ncbi:DNA-3-methyladenine glycosylase [Oceanobacillus sp. Castelsardo]|uniref:DNA-3-methyladenine glycosylase family protein n=1 Tax=Oceanobacillus sp. Castelsardo TaxID=1851204 RepID=UPI000838C374|nr:DNA-3-methyladenine glycosylase [Oceanobacillus sp. Castelsardo]
MWEEEVKLDTLYDFDYSLYRISFDPLASVQLKERKISIPFVIGEEKHIIYVQAIGTTNQPRFIVKSKDIRRKEEILDYIFDLFQWKKDLTNIFNHFVGTNLASLFDQYPGTPIVREFDLYYSLMKTIIHQQLNMKFAYVLSTRFIECYGKKIDGVWFYPTPEEIGTIKVEDLRELQFSGRKAEYVIDTSRLIADGKLDLKNLREKDDDEILTELIKIRGIGQWTAENWLMFGLGREDHFPKADIGIQNAVKGFLGMDRKPSKEELEKISQEWHPYRSYASLTLWRSIEE